MSLPSDMSETSSRVRFPADGSMTDRVEYIPVGGVPGTNGTYITDEDVYQGLSNLLVWACKPMKAYRVSKDGFEGGEPKKTPTVDIGVKNIWNPTGTLGVGGLFLLRFDGYSDTDPGVAGAGAVIYDVDGEEYWFGFKKLGNAVTESIAEYCAMIYGLKAAISLGVRNIILESDSNLVVKQMNGQWEVKNPTLKKFYVCIQKWIAKFDYMEVRYIKSTTNTRANWLAKNANDLS
jgi:ribonuclease HI